MSEKPPADAAPPEETPSPPRMRQSSVISGGACEAKHLPELDAEFPSPELLHEVHAVAQGRRPKHQAETRGTGRRRLGPADRILVHAREMFEEAKRRLEEAEQRAAEMEREAYEKGFQQGEAAGLEIGQAKLAPLITEVNALLERLADSHTAVIAHNKEQLIDLALAIAARLLHRDLELSPDQILQTIEEVLAHVGREQRVRLRLSQIDFQMLLDHQADLPSLARLGDRITFEVDPEMMKGGCTVQTPTGTIDATIETMFAEMRRSLTGQRSTYRSDAGEP